jgi:hypothetical protein
MSCTALLTNMAAPSPLISAERATRRQLGFFFRQALQRHGEPRSITLDGFEPGHAALQYMGMRRTSGSLASNRVRDFTRWWSCSTILFKYLQLQIFTEFDQRMLTRCPSHTS